jgi:hypothetical protein
LEGGSVRAAHEAFRCNTVNCVTGFLFIAESSSEHNATQFIPPTRRVFARPDTPRHRGSQLPTDVQYKYTQHALLSEHNYTWRTSALLIAPAGLSNGDLGVA